MRTKKLSQRLPAILWLSFFALAHSHAPKRLGMNPEQFRSVIPESAPLKHFHLSSRLHNKLADRCLLCEQDDVGSPR